MASSGNTATALADCDDDELTARRGACCREDAVFSRTPNWVGRVFMFVMRSVNSLSFDLFLDVVVGVLARPALELVVLLEQQLEGLADHVGRVRINEFRIHVQAMSDFFLQADLEGRSFRLL